MAYPQRYVVDPAYAGDERMKKCVDACPYGAIDLGMEPVSLTARVGSLVWATGWTPYDAAKIDNLGFGTCANVHERDEVRLNERALGRIVGPPREAVKIGFVQCAGRG
jgi:quinone-modifying oxidoreductase subunit QmoA